MSWRGARAAIGLSAALAGGSCGKVPLHDVNASFLLADASWFAEEETLFVFWEVTAEQGLGDPSVIELTWVTDDERVDWTPVDQFEPVHTHREVDCGVNRLCGSTSIHVPLEPREVDVRLRYHREGKLALETDSVYNVVDEGPAHSSRSLAIYGVFDEGNSWVQWRGRHQFPTLRNEEAQYYGLRRWFQVDEQRHGSAELRSGLNPYAYGEGCPGTFEALDLPAVETTDRAVFNDEELPTSASASSLVCGSSTVTDATGTFTTDAVAHKNPEVRPAYPVLRSPVHDALPLPFFLAPCEGTISEDHEDMQRQRLQLEGVPTTCIDDWDRAGFADELAVLFGDALTEARPQGEDMILVIGLHHDDEDLTAVVEDALAQIVPPERHKSTPRLAGAFVLDSFTHDLATAELEPVTLWCPADLPDINEIPDASEIYCAILPDNPEFDLGPFSFGTLPILTSREQYLDFIDSYSKKQAGQVLDLTFRVPEFATTSDHIDLGEFGVVTFLDDERISADEDDAFSYCVNDEELSFFFFRSDLMQDEQILDLIAEECDEGSISEEVCTYLELGILPLNILGEWHSAFLEGSYELGVFWEFPFLVRMEYEVYAAGSVSALGLSVPFGLGQEGESYLGTQMWTSEEFSLEKTLTQCRRFCDHPTFDSAGVYQVLVSFREGYAQSCYDPDYPEPGDPGFPDDP